MSEKESIFVWFGERVLPGLTASGICAACFFLWTLLAKVDDISHAVQALKPHEARIERLERNTVDVQMIERVVIALDNAELEGQGNFATKAVSRVLKHEVLLKKEGR